MKLFTGKREFLSTARGGSCDGTTGHVYVTQHVCAVLRLTAHGRTALRSWLRAGRTALRSWLCALRTCAPRGSLTTPPAAAVLRVRCLHSRLCCSRDLAIYRETFSDSPAALENPFEPLDHLEEEILLLFILSSFYRIDAAEK